MRVDQILIPVAAVGEFLWLSVRSTPVVSLFFVLFCFVGGAADRAAQAQMLEGDWVRESAGRIDQCRKTGIRVIVLDQNGTAVPEAEVRIEQIRHEFSIGFCPLGGGWPDVDGHANVWRCFNSLSLEQLTQWSKLAPKPSGAWVEGDLEPLVQRAESLGLTLRWGGVVSADMGRNPSWAGYLKGDQLQTALETHLKRVLLRYGGRIDQFDIYTHSLDHDWIDRELGMSMVRRLYEQAKAAAPRASICVRFEDIIAVGRMGQVMQQLQKFEEALIPIDQIAVELRIGGVVSQQPFQRVVDRIGRLGRDIVVAGLEVGGVGAVGAAINLETVLRTLFAEPGIRGIWYTSLMPSDSTESSAALFDEEGQPTVVGQIFDALWRNLWWTDEQLTTDELGNVFTRVFAGTHQISATLPDKQTLHTTVWLPRSDEERIIVLEPLK